MVSCKFAVNVNNRLPVDCAKLQQRLPFAERLVDDGSVQLVRVVLGNTTEARLDGEGHKNLAGKLLAAEDVGLSEVCACVRVSVRVQLGRGSGSGGGDY